MSRGNKEQVPVTLGGLVLPKAVKFVAATGAWGLTYHFSFGKGLPDFSNGLGLEGEIMRFVI